MFFAWKGWVWNVLYIGLLKRKNLKRASTDVKKHKFYIAQNKNLQKYTSPRTYGLLKLAQERNLTYTITE